MQLPSLLMDIDVGHFTEFREAIAHSLDFFGVELQVVFAALAVFLLDLFLPLRFSKQLAWVAILGCALPAWSLATTHLHPHDSRLFLGMVSFDSYSSFFKMFFLLGSIPVILLTYMSKSLDGRRMGEYYGILLSSVFGAMLMASSTHFLMLFLSLELLSLASYVLVGYRRTDRLGVEAALKYIIYGSVAAAIMAFGMSLYYGLTGSADLADLAHVVRGVVGDGAAGGEAGFPTALMALIAILLIFVGIAYKISSIPMHFWAPDAYQGAPTPVTAFLAVLSKAAGFAVAIRFFQSLTDSVNGLAESDASYAIWAEFIGAPASSPYLPLIMIISIVTMTVGNLAALWQDNLKRMLAYSSIAHAGYMMMGLTLLDPNGAADVGGIEAIAFYLLAYLAMNFGVFAIVIIVENRGGTADLASFRGLGKRAPLLAAAMIVFIFSLIGLPPTGGFMGKFKLFMGLLDMERSEYYILAIAAAINTAVSAYYYLKIAREMYFSEASQPDGEPSEIKGSALANVMVASMVVMTFYLFFRAQGILATVEGLELEL